MTKEGITKASASAPDSRSKAKPGARKTDKQRLQERLIKAGVNGVEAMTYRQMRNELSRIKSEGATVPDLRTENHAPVSLSKDPKVQEMREKHLMEEVDVNIRNKKTNAVTTVKRSRFLAILDMLAQEALGQKSISAAKEYMDRTIGKSKQEIEHSGEIKVDDQRVPTDAEIEAAEKFRDAIRASRGL